MKFVLLRMNDVNDSMAMVTAMQRLDNGIVTVDGFKMLALSFLNAGAYSIAPSGSVLLNIEQSADLSESLMETAFDALNTSNDFYMTPRDILRDESGACYMVIQDRWHKIK